MRLGLIKLPANYAAPDIVESLPGAGTVTDIFTGAAKTYQDYLNARAQIEAARLRAKTEEARLKAQYKRAGREPFYYGGEYSAPMKPATRTMLMIGAGVLAVIAIGYTVMEKKKAKR